MSDIDKHGDGDPHIAEFELCHNPEEVLRIGRDFQRQDTFRGAQHDTVKLLCDTIEYLRDRLSKPVGNSAAMREALIIARKAICHYAENICQSLSWENSDLQSNCADVLCAHRVLCKAKTAINAALSEQERNCDFYDNKTDAETRFVEETGENDTSQHYWQMFAIWLFDLAAERKGSNR